MICVTGKEATARALAERVEGALRHPGLRSEQLLFEVRLDALERLDDEVFGLVRRFGPQFVACCRPTRQGGWFAGPEADRLDILERAAEAGAATVDLEADLNDDVLRRRAFRGKVLLSWHAFAPEPLGWDRMLEEMARREVKLVKLAAQVEDAADLEPLRQAGKRYPGRAVVIGMGPAGLLSRCRYPAFGAPWTYVRWTRGAQTAPGQLTLEEAVQMGMPSSATQPFVALMGGPQVLGSPGPRVYNRLFRMRGLPWSYVPVITRRLGQSFELLRALGARGLSVTMPHKTEVLALATPDGVAREVGAANSVRFDATGAVCTNTDPSGVREPLREAMALLGEPVKRALVLGAGGAGRAAILACRSLGLAVLAAARDTESAHLGLDAEVHVVPWAERAEADVEILVNATPLSGDASPWPTDRPLHKRVVFDLAMAGGSSKLLAQAVQEGAMALGPEDMWVVQGALQMSWITGTPFDALELKELLP
jgi:3-dehydroquinate dehydratase / shikimate dehydrogenase